MTETHSHGPEVLAPLAVEGRELRKLIPDVYKGYAQLNGAAFSEGELTKVTKELIALGIAISKQCDGCIASHTKKLVLLGASEQQVAEAIGVTIAMNGGPATVYGPRALAAFREWVDSK